MGIMTIYHIIEDHDQRAQIPRDSRVAIGVQDPSMRHRLLDKRRRSEQALRRDSSRHYFFDKYVMFKVAPQCVPCHATEKLLRGIFVYPYVHKVFGGAQNHAKTIRKNWVVVGRISLDAAKMGNTSDWDSQNPWGGPRKWPSHGDVSPAVQLPSLFSQVAYILGGSSHLVSGL